METKPTRDTGQAADEAEFEFPLPVQSSTDAAGDELNPPHPIVARIAALERENATLHAELESKSEGIASLAGKYAGAEWLKNGDQSSQPPTVIITESEYLALRAFVAAYDKDAKPQASTYATRRAVREARGMIK